MNHQQTMTNSEAAGLPTRTKRRGFQTAAARVFPALLLAVLAIVLAGSECFQPKAAGADHRPTGARTIGTLEILDPRFEQLISSNAKIEKLAEGFAWAEGPIWFKDGGYLLLDRKSVV